MKVIDGGDGFKGVLVIPKLIKLYTLDKYSILHVNHTSVKWLNK